MRRAARSTDGSIVLAPVVVAWYRSAAEQREIRLDS